ncbi:MAG TPA: hypothetical protein PLB02_10805 [Thermoanaerobaculia bacterium]|nr:hypothetical protein [Thermoanaerobaculia bacterium]HQR67876.1 hypothetical protein [Thermoanaerobaculia bacterium]
MKALVGRMGFLFLSALIAVVATAPLVAADDIGMFRLASSVRVGDATLIPGTYVFRATLLSDRSVIVILDENQTQVMASTLVLRTPLALSEIKSVGELVYDSAVRSFSHGYWQYNFFPKETAGRIASGPRVVATEIALAR